MFTETTTSNPALVLLHFFGNSHREWSRVAPRLALQHRLLMFDMPGFGDAAELGALDVAAMADYVDTQIRAAGIEQCVVVGHSMTGKISGALASRKPNYLRGLILVTPSPPPPEPFTDEVRRRLMAFDGSRDAAAAYLDGITAQPLAEEWREPAIADAMRASLVAWKTWISTTSQEDWSAKVGVLSLPALVIAGADDPSLGADIQRRLTMPHLEKGELKVIAGGHVLPLENPEALIEAIESFGPCLA